MSRLPPASTRTDTLFPYPTLFRSSVYDCLHAGLTTDLVQTPHGGYKEGDVLRIAMKFQQLTGPVTAKAIEDTVFYRYARLISLNEVGGTDRKSTRLNSSH